VSMPRGSKKPSGGWAPSSLSKAWRAVVALPTWAGAKAAAEPARSAAMASFILVGTFCFLILMDDIVFQAERALISRNFVRALDLSNDALLKQSQSGIVPLFYHEQHCNQQDGRFHIIIETPLCLLEWTDAEHVEHKFPWLICLSREISKTSRLAAVAVQCIGEQWKQYPGDLGKSIEKRQSRVLASLRPFRGIFSGRVEPMPLELAILWVQFCSFLGCNASSALLSAEILSQLLRQLHEVGAVRQEERMIDDCQELAHLLFVKTLPFCNNTQFVKAVLGCFDEAADPAAFNSMPSRAASISSCHLPQEESIRLIFTFLEKFRCQTDIKTVAMDVNNLLRHECFIRTQQSSLGLTKKTEKNSSTDVNEGVHTSHKSSEETNDEESVQPTTLRSQFYSRFVVPLWSAENRWSNRAQLAVAGLVALTAWKRRRHAVSLLSLKSKRAGTHY